MEKLYNDAKTSVPPSPTSPLVINIPSVSEQAVPLVINISCFLQKIKSYHMDRFCNDNKSFVPPSPTSLAAINIPSVSEPAGFIKADCPTRGGKVSIIDLIMRIFEFIMRIFDLKLRIFDLMMEGILSYDEHI